MTACEDKYAGIQKMIAGGRHEDAMAALEQFVAEHDDHHLAMIQYLSTK